MERVEKKRVIVPADGVLIRTSKTSTWTLTEKSPRDDFPISNNIWEWFDWGNEVNRMSREDSQDGNLKVLPEELVEKILAMVPFPQVFKARVLSKSWLARLSPILSQDDEEIKCLAISFQKQVLQWSTNWKEFGPVHGFNKDGLLAGYDQLSHRWQRLPSLSFLHDAFGFNPIQFSQMQGCYVLMDGALLLCVVNEDLYVANVLTQEWKQLPPHPYRGENWSCLSMRRVVLSHTLETYKVILLPASDLDPVRSRQDHSRPNYVQTYDSATSSWSNVKVASSIGKDCFYAAYVNGVLYFVEQDLRCTFIKVMSLNVQEQDLVNEPVTLAKVELRRAQILALFRATWAPNLLIMVLDTETGPKFFLKIDLERKQLLGFSDQSLPDYPQMSEIDTVSDGDYGFAHVEVNEIGVVIYNVHAGQWDRIHDCRESDYLKMWEGSTGWGVGWGLGWEHDICPVFSWDFFRPGLNPFVSV